MMGWRNQDDVLRLRFATLRTNGIFVSRYSNLTSPKPFVLSVAERQRSEVEGRHSEGQ